MYLQMNRFSRLVKGSGVIQTRGKKRKSGMPGKKRD